MNTEALLLGILPLLFFVIVDSFAGLKAALITAVVLAILEAILSIVWFGELDSVTGFSVLLVIAMAIASYKKNSPLFLKMQPVIIGCLISIVLLVSYLMDRPYLFEAAMKYKDKLPELQQLALEHPRFQDFLKLSTLTLSISLFFHAALTAWSALKLSNWWWIIIRGVGFYLFMAIGAFIAHRIVFSI